MAIPRLALVLYHFEMPLRFLPSLLCLALCTAPLIAQQSEPSEDAKPWGHSNHGSAYDVGPRQKPWLMEGIGSTPFPITSSNPEVQQWFDQGITLLHGFWWFEAERTMRWCIKLDPECAMAYWGLALANKEDPERSAEFLKEAVKRKDSVTPRERAFIETAELFAAIRNAKGDDRRDAEEAALVAIDRLLMDYPNDVEAKAMYWLMSGSTSGNQGSKRYGLEAVLDDILELDPDHVGALHYRVHNWDGKEGHYVIDSCMQLPEIAPNCGHLLHMPGHVLSGIGLWHEAAIAMDSATRCEKTYMNERLILPEQNWDYVHNLDYLCYIQEQLGMVEQALIGAEQLSKTPAFVEMPFFTTMSKFPMIRALEKFERWEDILDGGRLHWDMDNPMEKSIAGQSRVRALIGLSRLDEAKAAMDEIRDGEMGPQAKDGFEQLEALYTLADGDYLKGLSLLTAAAEKQEKNWHNDPPHESAFLFNLLGDTYLELGAPKLAAECYERTLETVFHDGFALSGLVVSYAQLGETAKAEEAMSKLMVAWSDADRPNRWLDAAEATGITAEPFNDPRIKQRNYKTEVLDVHGPSIWVPGDLPQLSVTNAEGKTVTLADYEGKNVMLIFYLGEECVHCIEQLKMADDRLEEIQSLDTVVLAVSQDELEEIAAQQPDMGVTLLSDNNFANAHRFNSFDDFEEIELHSTFLINRDGTLHWSRIGGEPFTDFDFLIKELKRMNRVMPPKVASAR
jgi:peroxiredoxin